MVKHYYNEFDPKAAAWLRELITEGHIPKGDVDERSITEVRPAELVGYTQCHFFCGIGGWPYALQLAGWPIDRPVWTGSCPCQPFSSAGKQKGNADDRHLWPAFFDLTTEVNMRQTSVTFRGKSVDVMYEDGGYEPDTNAHEIDWYFCEEQSPEATDEEEDAIYQELAHREYEPYDDDVI